MYKVLFLVGFCLLAFAGCQKTTTTQAPDLQRAEIKPITGKAYTPETDNILQNPSFESGLAGWKWLDWSKGWAAFALSNTHAYDGLQSLHLPVISTDNRPTVVWGGVQEIELTQDIPECIEGYYYVENWAAGDWKQYLQLVVIDLSHPLGPNRGQAQLRYIISGSKTPPLSISNAQYLFAEKERRDTPVLGQWTHFSVNPKADFMKHWQYTPTAGAKLRVLFEARFDLHKTNIPARGDVYFDHLYFGPATATRCADPR